MQIPTDDGSIDDQVSNVFVSVKTEDGSIEDKVSNVWVDVVAILVSLWW